MPNSITIRTSAPNAKQTAAEINGIHTAASRLSGVGQSVKQGLAIGFGVNAISMVTTGVRMVTDGIGQSIEKASDLNETMSKSKEIFGDHEGELEKWARGAATAFGQSERQALDTASAFGGLFEGVGEAEDAAAEKSRKLTELGSDLASFFDTDVQTAVDSLRSGLSGESEPLRKYNVFLSDTAVTTELVKEGAKKTNGQWTESQKILARYKIILDQTKTAQGDFARTADGLANSQRSADATLENLQATLGQKALPAQLAFTKAEIAALDATNDFQDGYKNMTDDLVNTPKTNFLDSLPSKQEVEASLAGLKAIPGEIDGTMQGLLFNLNVGGVKDTWQKSIDDLNNYLATTAFDGTGQAIEKGWQGQADAALDKMFENWSQNAVSSKWATIFEENITNKSPLIAAAAEKMWSGIDDEFQRARQDILDHSANLPGEIGDAIKDNKDFVKDGMDDLTYLIEHPVKRQKEIARIEGALTSSELAAGLSSNDPAVREAARAWEQALMERYRILAGDAFTWGYKTLNAFVAGYRDAANKTSFDNILRIIANAGPTSGGRAGGGPVKKGVPYVVGEKRPELFVPDESGTIVPSVPALGPGSKGGAWGGVNIGPITVQVTAPMGTDGHLFGRAVADALGEELGYQARRMSEAPRY